MRKTFVRGRSWWNWLLRSGEDSPAPQVSPISFKANRLLRKRRRPLTFEALEPLCMLTSSIVISGPQSVMEPMVPGTTTIAQFSISLPMFGYGDSGTVHWATEVVSGGAVPGQDYVASSGTVSLSYLNTQVYVTVPVSYDQVSESPEALRVVLSSPTGNLAIMVGTATTNITDSNPPPPPPPPMPPPVPTVIFSGSASNFMLEGDNREIHIGRDMSFDSLTVYYVIAQDSIATSSDVSLLPSGSVTFAPGQSDATITLTAIDDAIIEIHELLKLSLVQFPAPNQGPGAYMVGSAGDSLTTIGDNNEAIFSDLTVDWKTPDDEWQNSPDNEMLWEDDQLRWTVTLPPEEVSFREELTSLKLLKRPHDNPIASWIEITPQSVEQNPNNQAQFFIYAHPMIGDWDLTVHGIFGLGINAWLAAPKHRAANGFAETIWTTPEDDSDLRLEMHDDGQNTNYTGPRIYPEYTLPPDRVPDQKNHSKVGVKVTLAMPVKDIPADVYFKALDPDHAFNPATPEQAGPVNANGTLNNFLDGNDVVAEILPSTTPKTYTTTRKPDDNRKITGEGIGGTLADTMKSFPVDTNTTNTTFTITAIQPGNNFRVVITGRPELLPFRIFGPDGVTVIQDRIVGQPPVSPGAVTRVLTVWRTLHIERDSMSAPPTDDQSLLDHFADAANDDPNPGDVRDADISLLSEKFRPANIDVVADLANFDDKDNGFFNQNINTNTSLAPNGRAYKGGPSGYFMGEFWTKTGGQRRASGCATLNYTSRFWDLQNLGV